MFEHKTRITKVFHICYGHHLPNYCGPCANQHGHNSEIQVTLEKGNIPGKGDGIYHGMVMDFRDIKRVIEPIVNEYDHKQLNDLPEFAETNPTAENMVNILFNKISAILEEKYPSVTLVKVRLSETDDAWAEASNE